MKSTPTFSFLGASLALDFSNTVANRNDPLTRRDLFSSVDDVSAWAAQSPQENALVSACTAQLRREHGALARIVSVREAVHDAFAAVVAKQPIAASAVTGLDVALRRCLSGRCLQASGPRVSWFWLPRVRASDRLLAPILLDAVLLLEQPQNGRVRECDGSGCGWLFMDRSPAQRRRWCSMADCGNRAKARRHYRARVNERRDA